ncbi:ATP-dependent helicase [Psychrobacillus sp. FSL H8-0510]|uniref:ATP-dependent helicase n=1 Tax=Psychrobacillus sp. FSL H8-0510 TaxID=2921394 RepID=UPI0030F60C76
MDDFFKRKNREIGVNLNDVQHEAVVTTEGPVLLLASPGSGKTTVTIMRIGYLIEEKGIDPSKILAVTFSNESAKDMDERFKKFFSNQPLGCIHFSTIHSLAYEIFRAHLKKTGQKAILIETNEKSVQGYPNKRNLLKELYEKANGEDSTDEEIEGIMTYITFVKNRMLSGKELDQVEPAHAKDIYLAYEKYKASQDQLLFDYDDMLTHAERILREDAELRAAYQTRFDYVMTDESQDTSLVQHRIIEHLVSVHRNVCVVADDDQSIYSWRGADPEYLLAFEQAYPGAVILFMQQNYRSSKEVVEVSNRFIKRNTKRYPKEMFTNNGHNKKPLIEVTLTYEEQIEKLTKAIKQNKNFKETAVLYRNNESSIAIVDALEKAGIPFYQKESTHSFFNHFILKDLKNFFRLSYVTKVKHRKVFEAISRKTKLYMTKDDFTALDEYGPEDDLWEALAANKKAPAWKRNLVDTLHKETKRLKFVKPKKAIRMIRTSKAIAYDHHISLMCDRLGMKKESLFGVLEMCEIIAEKEKDLPSFIARLDHLQETMKQSKLNKGKDAVTLTTFHSSKGLEFEDVFMIDLLDGIIPSRSDQKKEAEGDVSDMEEATRLFYVGMTRAKKNLTMMSYTKRFEDTVRPSGFLSEVYALLNPEKKSAPAWESKPIKPVPSLAVTGPKSKAKESTKIALHQGDFVVGDTVKHGQKEGTIIAFHGKDVAVCKFKTGPKKILTSHLKRA